MFCQCEMYRDSPEHKGVVKAVEWVPKKIAFVGNRVRMNGHVWTIHHAGAESADPRSAHESKT